MSPNASDLRPSDSYVTRKKGGRTALLAFAPTVEPDRLYAAVRAGEFFTSLKESPNRIDADVLVLRGSLHSPDVERAARDQPRPYIYDSEEEALKAAHKAAKGNYEKQGEPSGVRVKEGDRWRDEASYGE